MAQQQSYHRPPADNVIDTVNASAPKHPVTPHAVATSCGMYTCVQDLS
jgi:hypothetical protein